jgi:ParB family chromosome partitioning protein
MDTLVDIERLHLSPHRPRGPVRPPSAEVRQWIEAQGLLQPILVRRLNRDEPAEYEIVSGESYWKAAQDLQIYRVPVLVRNDLSDAQVRTALQLERAGGRRSDPIAEARAIAALKAAGLTDRDIGERLGLPRHQVTQARRLLKLIDPAQAALIGGQLSVGHARVLASLDEGSQEQLLRDVRTKRLSVRQTEERANELRDRRGRAGHEPPGPVADNAIPKDAATLKLEQDLSETLGCPLSFELHADGSGRVVIDYPDLEVLDGVLERIRGMPRY